MVVCIPLHLFISSHFTYDLEKRKFFRGLHIISDSFVLFFSFVAFNKMKNRCLFFSFYLDGQSFLIYKIHVVVINNNRFGRLR